MKFAFFNSSFSFRSCLFSASQSTFGAIAQEMEQVLPELVSTVGKKHGYKGVNYIGLVPWILKAVQELDEKVDRTPCDGRSDDVRHSMDELRREVATLKAQMNAILHQLK